MKKIGLIDVDSKIPNLALMKLSSWHKSRGDTVSFYNKNSTFDIVYASKVFSYTKDKEAPPNTIKGGSGYDLNSHISSNVEEMYPDYSLYNCTYALGFTSRGCIRSCKFCIVSKKEGKLTAVGDIYNFWNGQKEIVIMDNNIFGLPDHFQKVSSQIIKEEILVDFNQGLDIRLLDDPFAKILKKMKPISTWRFAFDSLNYEKAVRKGAVILKNNGLISKSMFYVLVGFNSSIEEDMERFRILSEYKFNTFCMVYEDGSNIKGDLKSLKILEKVRMPIGNKAKYIRLAHENMRKK